MIHQIAVWGGSVRHLIRLRIRDFASEKPLNGQREAVKEEGTNEFCRESSANSLHSFNNACEHNARQQQQIK